MLANLSPPERQGHVQGLFLHEWALTSYRGTFEGATGTGKTRAAVLAVANELEKNPGAVIYIGVPTTQLRDEDWPNEFKKWGYEHLLDKVKLVCHVAMDKIKVPEIDLFVWDECHHATPANCRMFDKVKVYKILGLTATQPKGTKSEKDREKRALIDALCPSILKVPLEDAIELELVADFEVRVLKFPLDTTDRYISVVIGKAGNKKTVTKTESERYKELTKLLQQAVYAKGNNEGLKFMRIQQRTAFLYNLRSKEKLAKICMNKMLKDDNRTLIFCGSIRQCNDLCGPNSYHSQTDNAALDSFQEKKISYMGAVDALNEGKNLNELDQVLVVQLNSVSRKMIQRIGRAVRRRKVKDADGVERWHKALIVVLVAEGTADEKWYKESFSEFDKSRIKEYRIIDIDKFGQQ